MHRFTHHRQSGFTLIEVLITITVAAILLAIAAPSSQRMIEKARLKALTEAVYTNLQYAKSEALKGEQSADGDIRVTLDRSATPQCLGLQRGRTYCDCSETVSTESDFCQIDGAEKRILINDSNFPDAEIDGSTKIEILFDSVRGTASAQTITIKSSKTSDMKINVIVSALGRVRVCIPSGAINIVGYEDC